MGPNKPWVVLLLFLLSLVSTVYGRVDEKDQDIASSKKVLTGGVVGATQNAARYVIKSGGTRPYNGVNIFDKAFKTAKGDPKWFARIDYATAKNPVTHLNVNKAITGLRDPHIKISGLTARAAGVTGQALNVVQTVAPLAMAASVFFDAVEVMDDLNRGNEKLAVKKVFTKTAAYSGASYGATTGAAYGTAIFPGVGTLIGGLIGGVVGGVFGGEVAAAAVGGLN